MSTIETEKMYTRQEAARKLGISRATLDRRRYAGEIEEIQLGPHKVRITEDALKQYLINHTKPCNASISAAQAS